MSDSTTREKLSFISLIGALGGVLRGLICGALILVHENLLPLFEFARRVGRPPPGLPGRPTNNQLS